MGKTLEGIPKSEGGCTECHREEARLAPMLRDEVWARLADKDETLCTDCFFERMVERDVTIGVSDMRPCLFNLLDSPLSWFDVLMRDETKPPANMDKWREAYVKLQYALEAMEQS